MYEYFFLSQLTLVLVILLSMICFLLVRDRKNNTCLKSDDLMDPPQPRRLPVIGHLHLLGGYDVPYQAFAGLRKKFGNVFGLKLGSVDAVVVSGHQNIKEILITKGHHFDGRPNFQRYSMLFSGRENSFAFCDWSDIHKIRRDTVKVHIFPRRLTNKFELLESVIKDEASVLVSQIDGPQKIKPLLAESAAKIFAAHFCSTTFGTEDQKLKNFVRNFDAIFYEMNQGYAADFLPFLLPFYWKHLGKMTNTGHEIREFIESSIIGDRYEKISVADEPKDYVETLLKQAKFGDGDRSSWDAAMFALEDIIGGHCAISNFMVKCFGFLVKEQDVQKRIQEEIDSVTYLGDNQWRMVSISDRNSMPYTEGTIFEAVRIITSPIVPRVANQDTSLNGYRIKKGTLMFLDNYDLSISEELWDEPHKFKPERFIVDNRFTKPEHFLPFGGGRRSCMGYKMVQLIGFGLVSAILQRFTVLPIDNEDYTVAKGSLAVPFDTFKFNFVKRHRAVVG